MTENETILELIEVLKIANELIIDIWYRPLGKEECTVQDVEAIRQRIARAIHNATTNV